MTLRIRKAADYMTEMSVDNVDFVKIDTEGYELEVLKGFGEALKKVKVIQFEYGGTYLDSGVRLADVVAYVREVGGFDQCYYLSPDGMVPITDVIDHYFYCNIVCLHSSFEL